MGDCGSLNVIGPHKLIGSDTIRRCHLVGVGMALLEDVCHCRGGLLGFIYAQAMSSDSVHFCLSSDRDIELSAPSPIPCRPAHHPVPL